MAAGALDRRRFLGATFQTGALFCAIGSTGRCFRRGPASKRMAGCSDRLRFLNATPRTGTLLCAICGAGRCLRRGPVSETMA